MIRRALAAAAVLVTAVACSTPPEKERHQAEGAIAAAREVGAAVYAPAELAAAEGALQKYDDAVAQRDYRQALSLAVEARDTAYQAAKKSGDEKAAARSRAEALVTEVTRLMQLARTRLTAVPRGPTVAKLRAAMGHADPALQDARSRLERQDYRGALAVLAPRADELRAQLESASPPAPRRSH
jgi:hypothetical protein